MTLKQALFILRHGSAEGVRKYLEAIKVCEDEITRQKAEIERLKYNLKAVLDERADHSEAIKEFAERLKELMKYETVIYDCHIDNLVKEMTD